MTPEAAVKVQEDADGEIARAGLGVTVYARGALASSWDAVGGLLDRTVSAEWAGAFNRIRDSSSREWRSFDSADWRHIREEIRASRDRAPLWQFEIADARRLPAHSFRVVSVHPMRGVERASLVALRVPTSFRPALLREIASEWADMFPFWCGTAGFVAAFDESDRTTAWTRLWVLARRYWGLEVQVPEKSTWDAVRGLPAVNWLTMLGRGLVTEKSIADRLRSREFPELTIVERRNGWIVEAGPHPSIGDVNAGEFSPAYGAASRLLADALAPDPSDLPGPFADLGSTESWRRRFIDPAGWLEADPE